MQTLTVEQLKSLIDDRHDMTLINVLAEEEFERAHIPGSLNVPVKRDDFIERVEELVGSKDDTVVVYCASFDCEASPKAARRLEDAGFSDVHDFEGGIKEWLKAGHEVNRPAESKS